MKKKIACFGCSITGGVYLGKEPRESWPLQLSYRLPNVEIYNFGLQGTSVLYTINMIERVKDTLNPDLIITQIANPVRLTFYDFDFQFHPYKDLSKMSNNYYAIPYDIKGVYPINGIVGKKEKKEIYSNKEKLIRYEILENLYKYLDDVNHFDVEYKTFALRIKSLSNFCFISKQPIRQINGLQEIPCIEKELGTENFLKFVVDKAYHFGETGTKWIAEWVMSHCNL